MPSLSVHAYHLTEQLKLTSLLDLFPEKPFRASGTELVFKFEKDQYLILYNFGSMVLYNVDRLRADHLLSVVQKFISPKDEIVTSEEFVVEEGPKLEVDFRKAVIPKITFEKIQIVGLVLAQSTALEYFENLANDLLQKSGAITDALEKRGRFDRRDPELIKFIGFCLNTKQKVISSVFVLDSPEPTWESATLEALHRQMVDMFELRERYRTLEYKLKTVQETVEILADLSRQRRSMNLEIAIVALIAFEILLIIFDLVRGHLT